MRKFILSCLLVLAGVLGVQAQSMKIGYVNSQKVLDTMPSRRAAITEIMNIQKMGEQELGEMQAQIEKAYAEYQRLEPTRTATANQYEMGKLQRMQQTFEARSEELDQQLQGQSQAMNTVILARVKLAVEHVAVAQKMAYVIDSTSTLYTAGGIDITKEVITELLKLDAEATK